MRALIFHLQELLYFRKRRYKKNPNKILKFLLDFQHKDRQYIREYQLKVIKRILKKSIQETVFYKKLDYVDIANLSLTFFEKQIPAVEKRELKKHHKEFINDSVTPVFVHKTSGSTGVPMKIETSVSSEEYRYAVFLRFLSLWNLKIYNKNILIWAPPLKPNNNLLYKIKDWVRGRLLINVFDIKSSTIFKYVSMIERHNPKYIRGYKSGVFQLAVLIRQNDIKIKTPNLKVIIVTSEVLYDNERKIIEEVFDCKIANEYGSAETGIIANECPSGSMHINEESIFLTTRDGVATVVTELYNDRMPLINYLNGDRITISEEYCKCGIKSRVIKDIGGRVNDYIICEDGSKKSSLLFNTLFKTMNMKLKISVLEFKVEQRNSVFTFFLVPFSDRKHENDLISKFINDYVAENIGTNMKVIIKFVSAIDREKSGKLRLFINKSD